MKLTKKRPLETPGAAGTASLCTGQTGTLVSPPDSATRGAGFSFSSRLRGWLWGLLLVVVTVLAYQPAWNGKPIWDDAAHLTYPELRSLNGLVRIWTEPGVTQQYYPMVSSVFWVEHKLWGDATLGYHLVNILLHVAGALLLLKILRMLQFPAAGLAAALFALHPVQVESVAWMSELKNTLSGVCYFGSALAYLRFDRTRNKGAYAGALTLFVAGLLAKTVIATLPAALLVVFWWQRGKLSWKQDVLPLIPFLAVGITAGYFTSWMEREYVGAQGSQYSFSILERFLIAGRAIWFYLGKLFWPADLIFSYPRWKISATTGWQYLFPGGVALLLGGLWVIRRWARGPLAALLFFIGTLFPALGFVNVFPFKYSFVADHFQYLASIGAIAAASFGIHAFFREFGKRRVVAERAFCATLLAVLCVLTWRQCRMYTDIETLWQTTIERNPDCWLAQADLGAYLYEHGRVDQAIIRFRSSLAIQPDNAEGQNDLGAALDKKRQFDEAIVRFQKALALRPDFAEAHCNLGNDLLRRGQVDQAILEFQKAVAIRPDFAQLHFILGNALLQKGQVDGAITEFRAALELHPDDDQAHYNLGIALRQEGQKDEAILEFQKAAAIRPDFAEAQNNLGNALLQTGRVDEAIAHLQMALKIRPDYAQAHYNLGSALLQKRRVDQAVVEFQKLASIQPESPEAHTSLGNALLQAGQMDGAVLQFEKALAILPGFAEAQGNLAGIAWRLATSPNPSVRNGTEAVKLAQQTDQLAGGGNPMLAAILAAAYAEAGQFNEAVATARRALELANRQNSTAMVSSIQAELKCYQAGSPFRDKGGAP
ncbi:MAG TPA: tetratricopeptide repeat protein [Candidatus Baltobacteraceae bacterium]|jgi:tetratricopeptide (TPR) repeat protein|nr:tetratricopeptide repeat protein [Candidatus Baltobacteraceae bacterium]